MDEHTAKANEENDEMTVDYANNTMFEPTIWDLKLIFGEYSQRTQSVEYHTSITVPWLQAKMILYFLQANIAAHEAVYGKVRIPPEATPPEWTAPTPEQAESQPKSQEIFETLKKLRQQFLDNS